MKVFDIITESNNEFRVVRDQSRGVFNIVNSNGQVVGTERIAGAARSKAAELNNGPRISVNNNGTIKTEIEGKSSNGSPKDVLEDLEADGKVKKGKVAKASAAAGRTARRIGGFLIRLKIFSFLAAAQVVPVFLRYTEQRAALIELWAEIYPEGHPYAKGSPYAEEMINKTLQPYLMAAYAAIGAIAAETLLRSFRAGQALRIVRSIYAAIPPGSPWTAVVKVIMFVVTEGAVLTATWAIQKYGPDFFAAMANDKLDEYFTGESEATTTPAPRAPNVDEDEVAARVARDESGGSNDEEDVRSRINQEPRNTPNTSTDRADPADRPDIGNIRFRGAN